MTRTVNGELLFKNREKEMLRKMVHQVAEFCGVQVRAFDPEAMASCKAIYGDRDDMVYVSNKDEALEGADCLVVCTEWKTFWSPDFDKIKATLRQPVIIDGRNLYDPRHLSSMELEYYGIGRGLSVIKC